MKKKTNKIKNYATGGLVSNAPLELYSQGGQYFVDLDNQSDMVDGVQNVWAKGGIHIKPENKGKFTAFANRKGMGVQEAARHVLANKDKYSSTVVKRANFARNASKWKHGDGGLIKYPDGGPTSVVRADYDRDSAPKEGKYLLPDINRPSYVDNEGYTRSEYKMGINYEGKEYLIPTVVNGEQLTPDEAYQRFLDTGYHMGIYNSPEESNIAAQKRTAKYNFLKNPIESQNTIIEQYAIGGTKKPIGILPTPGLTDNPEELIDLTQSGIGTATQSKPYTFDMFKTSKPQSSVIGEEEKSTAAPVSSTAQTLKTEDELYTPSYMGVAGQALAGAINYAGQLKNINRLKAPGYIPPVNYAPTPAPKYVDMSSQLVEADRDYKAGVDQINKSGASLAQKQSLLQQLQAGRFAKRGQTTQAQENANSQIYNQYQQFLASKDMQEKNTNMEIMLQNVANKYGYDLTQTQGRNAALASLSNLLSQGGGAFTNLESSKVGLSALSKAYTKGLPERHYLNQLLYGKSKQGQDGE